MTTVWTDITTPGANESMHALLTIRGDVGIPTTDNYPTISVEGGTGVSHNLPHLVSGQMVQDIESIDRLDVFSQREDFTTKLACWV